MPIPVRYIAMFLYGEEEWSGRSVRIHRPAAHQQCNGRAEGSPIGDLLFEIAT